ncbi:MAG: hypothetical protein DMG08_28050, partial [Acidobacteria bacterium]
HGAKSYADAHLVDPLNHSEREQTKEADRGQQQSQAALTNIASGENKKTELGSAGTKALAYFEGIAERSLDDYLKRVRPPRVSAALKARIIAQLPHEGEVKPSTKMQAKLAALAPILRYHERSSTTEIKMIGVGHAFIGLHARAIFAGL